MRVSFRPEVKTSDPDWHGNAVRFATQYEARLYVTDLMLRWTAVRDTRVVESDDPANYEWKDSKAVPL